MNGSGVPRRSSGVRAVGVRAIAAVSLLSASVCAAADEDGPAPVVAPAATTTESAAPVDPWAEKVWAVVYAARKDESDAALAARIGALGPDAIPAVFDIYRQVDGDFGSSVRRSTLLASFRELGAARVVAFLQERFDDKTPHDELVEALQVVGEVAGPGSTKAALAAAFRLTPVELRRPASGAVARAAITATLNGDPGGWAALRLAWPALDPSLREAALAAVEDTRSNQGLRFFAGMLGRDAAAKVDLLRRMCRMPRVCARPLPDDAMQGIRWMTKDGEPALRAAALHFLGLFHDASAFGLALSMLDDPSVDVVDAALATLRRTSGAALPADPEAWRRWRLADDAWREKRFDVETALLASSDRAIVLATLTSLGARRRHAKDVTSAIAPFLSAPDPSIRRTACESIGALEDAGAAPILVAALDDADAEVVKAAGAALNAVTGLRLPADPAAWRGVVR